MHKQKRRDFNVKTTRADLYMYIGVGQGTCKKSRLYPVRAYTTLVVLVHLTNFSLTFDCSKLAPVVFLGVVGCWVDESFLFYFAIPRLMKDGRYKVEGGVLELHYF